MVDSWVCCYGNSDGGSDIFHSLRKKGDEVLSGGQKRWKLTEAVSESYYLACKEKVDQFEPVTLHVKGKN